MNRRRSVFRLLPVAAAVVTLIVACSDDDGSPSTPTASTSGVVTGSYWRNAKVCLDANDNGRCDSGEASTTTDANGAFTVAGQGAITVEVGTDAKRFDPATNTEIAVTQPLVFRAPQAANAVVSPISTELVALMEENGGDLSAAEASLASRLGVTAADLIADHNKSSDATVKATLQAEIDQLVARIGSAVADAGTTGDLSLALRNRIALDPITNVVVIYAENRGFDNLYGLYPNADGIPGVNPTSSVKSIEAQKDFDDATLPALPPVWAGVTAGGQTVTVPQDSTVGMPNGVFQIDAASGFASTGVLVDQSVVTRDLVHRFYNNQMQINGGKNDKFAAYSDAGGLSMGYYDGSKMAMWKLAQQYTLADHFFMGAFGGSFLNHQYLICACAPEYPNADADTSPARNSISAIDVDANGNFLRLTPAATAKPSVLDGAPVYLKDSTLTPKDAAGKFFAVNTMQPPYQPSGNAAATTDSTGLFADPGKANTLPAQTAQTIGDLLSAKNVDWAWYAGAWAAVKADPKAIYNNTVPNFQAHHQPFNYYAALDPVAHADARTAHLKDFDTQFLADAAAGTLPAVAFYKPQGNLNQHSGYANVADGDAHIAGVIAKLQASPQWKHMLIVVTYDENGGFYDHAAVPKGDRFGPGTRVPAIIVSPYAKKGFVDKTPYDTASILRFITHRWSLPTLAGIATRDQALVANGGQPMGDLSGALDFSQ